MIVSDKYVLNLLRDVVSARAGHKCEWPGCNKTECDPHHIFSRENKSTRYSPDNCAWLCNEHHRCAEASRNEFTAMMVEIRGVDWWIDLVHAKNQVVKFNDQFRAEWKERLQNELRGVSA